MAAKPELIDETKPTSPYREPPPPCEACAKRASALAPMLPFSLEEICCPTCDDQISPMPSAGAKNTTHEYLDKGGAAWWTKVCDGTGTLCLMRAIEYPWWKFWKKDLPAEFLPCNLTVGAVRHFHVRCGRCHTLFAMATKNA